ncbi:MAG: DUF922 domain-containing protein [Gemmatimonadaceae bacterium]
MERVTHYEIAGATAFELWREIAAKGPMSGGRRYAGRTDWDVRWTYGVDRRAGWCRPTDLRVAATVTTILPDYAPADTASALARDWAEYLKALETHERGHRDIVLEGLGNIRRAIRDVETPACTALSAEINRRAQAELVRVRERSEAYDRETDHGATQGAEWRSRIPASAAPPPR